MKSKCKRYAVSMARIEQEVRAQGKRVCRDYLVVTPRLEGVVHLLVTDQAHRTAYQAGTSDELVPWNVMKAQALQVDELQIIFPNGRVASAAQRRADGLKASRKAGHMSVLCLTVDAAVQRLRDANGAGVNLKTTSEFSGKRLAQKPGNTTAVSPRKE